MFIELPSGFRINSDHILFYHQKDKYIVIEFIPDNYDPLILTYDDTNSAKLAILNLDRLLNIKELVLRK